MARPGHQSGIYCFERQMPEVRVGSERRCRLREMPNLQGLWGWKALAQISVHALQWRGLLALARVRACDGAGRCGRSLRRCCTEIFPGSRQFRRSWCGQAFCSRCTWQAGGRGAGRRRVGTVGQPHLAGSGGEDRRDGLVPLLEQIEAGVRRLLQLRAPSGELGSDGGSNSDVGTSGGADGASGTKMCCTQDVAGCSSVGC